MKHHKKKEKFTGEPREICPHYHEPKNERGYGYPVCPDIPLRGYA